MATTTITKTASANITLTAGPWVEGTGNVTAQTGVGNADDIYGGDTVHPVQRGMEIIADRESQAVEGILAALSL